MSHDGNGRLTELELRFGGHRIPVRLRSTYVGGGYSIARPSLDVDLSVAFGGEDVAPDALTDVDTLSDAAFLDDCAMRYAQACLTLDAEAVFDELARESYRFAGYMLAERERRRG